MAKPKQLTFNQDAESLFALNHLPYDIETDKFQRLCSIGTLNYETRKIIISAFNEDNPQNKVHQIYKFQDWEIAFIEVTNPISNILLTNIESVITATVFSAIMQGESDYQLIVDYLISDYPLSINTETLKEMLNHKRKSITFAHNAKFDMNQLIYFNKKMEKFDFINTSSKKFVTLRYGNRKDIQEEYLLPLGNIRAGFRIKISHSHLHNTFWGTSTFSIYPTQSYSATYSYSTDTGLIASAVQRKELSLKKLSEGLPFSKYHLESESKIFSFKDFLDYNEQSHYLIVDCLSTLNVYSDLTYDFVFQRFAKLFNFDYVPSRKPFVSSINSTATIAKKNLELHITNETGLDLDTIHYNFKKMSASLGFFKSLENVEITHDPITDKYIYNRQTITHIYQGGKSENQAFYLIRTEKGEWIIIFDFKNQYPHMARLANAEKQFIAAAKGELLDTLLFLRDTSKAEKKLLNNYLDKLFKDVIKFDQNIENLTPIEDEQFLLMNGVIHFSTDKEIYIREKAIKSYSAIERNQDLYATGTFSLFIADFVFAILDLAFRENISVRAAFESMKVKSVNLMLFPDIDEYAAELFTKYVSLRDTFPKSDSMNTNLKFSGNSSYGIFGEGISNEYYKGKFYLPSITTPITGFAKFCTNIVELAAKRKKLGKPLNGDTDSIFLLGLFENLMKLTNLFSIIDPLQFENEKGFVDRALFLGRKKYHLNGYEAIETKEGWKPDFDNTVEIHKTHGAGSYGKKIKDVYHNIANDILNDVKPETAINNHISLFPLTYQTTIKDHNLFRYTNYFNQEVKNQFDYNGITVFTLKIGNKIIITTTNKEPIKGQFANYVNFKLKFKTNRLFKMHEYTRAQKNNDFMEELREHDREGFDWQHYDKEEKGDLVKRWNKVFQTNRITQKMTESEMDNKIDSVAYFVFNQDFYEKNQVVISNYEEYLDIKAENDKIFYSNIILTNFSPIDSREIIELWLQQDTTNIRKAAQHRLREILDNFEYAQKHLENRFLPKTTEKDIFDRYKRDKDPNSNDLIIKSGYIKNHPDLPITVDNKNYATDGFNFSLHKKLNELDHSAKLLADQTRYFAQAIINAFSRNASINYAKTHGIERIEYEKYVDLRPEKLPCPKKAIQCSIKLKFRLIPNIDKNNRINKEEINYNQIVVSYTEGKKKINDTWLDYLLHKNIVSRIDDEYVKLLDFDQFIHEVNSRIRGDKKHYSREFMSLFFLENEWSIEIIPENSINFNARLECKITVERNRMFFAKLHFNPASHKMVNMTTYNLQKSKLNEESDIIQKIVMEFLNKVDYIQGYNRKNKLMVENLEAENYLDLSNISLAHVVLKGCISKATTKLNEFHITTDLPCKKPALVVTIFDYIVQQYFEELYLAQDTTKEMVLRNNFYFKRSTQNSGTALVNRNLFSASIVYAKDYPQLANKMKRVVNKSNISSTHLKHLREHVLTKEKSIRVETQLKSPRAINELFNYEKHDILVSIMRNIIETVEKEIQHENKSVEIVYMAKSLNTYEYTFKSALTQLQSIIQEEIKLMRKYTFKIPTLEAQNKPPPS